MNYIRKEKLADETPKWSRVLLPLISTLLGSGTLWYALSRYNTLLNRPDWYGWMQVAFIVLVGVLCIWATVLFILGKSSGLAVLKLGISIIPLILFVNLIVLLFRVIHNIMQGDAALFLDRIF